MAVLPMLSVGGMQLCRTESYDSADKVVPRAAQLAGGIGIVYASLTAFWAIMLSIAGMSNFDAIAHAMTTIATGGYSTRTASIAAFDSVAIEWIVITGMIGTSNVFSFGSRKAFQFLGFCLMCLSRCEMSNSVPSMSKIISIVVRVPMLTIVKLKVQQQKCREKVLQDSPHLSV